MCLSPRQNGQGSGKDRRRLFGAVDGGQGKDEPGSFAKALKPRRIIDGEKSGSALGAPPPSLEGDFAADAGRFTRG